MGSILYYTGEPLFPADPAPPAQTEKNLEKAVAVGGAVSGAMSVVDVARLGSSKSKLTAIQTIIGTCLNLQTCGTQIPILEKAGIQAKCDIEKCTFSGSVYVADVDASAAPKSGGKDKVLQTAVGKTVVNVFGGEKEVRIEGDVTTAQAAIKKAQTELSNKIALSSLAATEASMVTVSAMQNIDKMEKEDKIKAANAKKTPLLTPPPKSAPKKEDEVITIGGKSSFAKPFTPSGKGAAEIVSPTKGGIASKIDVKKIDALLAKGMSSHEIEKKLKGSVYGGKGEDKGGLKSALGMISKEETDSKKEKKGKEEKSSLKMEKVEIGKTDKQKENPFLKKKEEKSKKDESYDKLLKDLIGKADDSFLDGLNINDTIAKMFGLAAVPEGEAAKEALLNKLQICGPDKNLLEIIANRYGYHEKLASFYFYQGKDVLEETEVDLSKIAEVKSYPITKSSSDSPEEELKVDLPDNL